MMYSNVIMRVYMMCSNVNVDRFPRFMLCEAVGSGSYSYGCVFHILVHISHCYCMAVGSYRTCYELVLEHISAVWLVCSTSLLHYVVNVCNGKEVLLQGIIKLTASLLHFTQ